MPTIAIAAGVVAAALSLTLIAYGPRWIHTVREPAGDGATRLATLCDDVGLDVERVLVRETSGDRIVDVQVLGPPGRRELLVTDAALRELDDERLRPLLAADAERVRARIDLLQAGSAGLAVGIMAAIYVTTLGLLEAMIGAWLVMLVAITAARRLRYAADERAAAAVGRDALVDALERVADLRGESVEPSSSWRASLEVEPSLGDRLGRLGAGE